MNKQDWQDDIENVRDSSSVFVRFTVYGPDGLEDFYSDMSLTAEQAVGMFRGIAEVSE